MPRTPRHLKDLVADPRNRRTHNARNLGMIAESLQHVGTGRSIVIDERNEVLAGNGVVSAAGTLGMTKVHVVDVEGDTVVAVRRRGLTAEQKRALAIFDNRTAELAEWNVEQLAADLKAGEDLSAFFLPAELTALFRPTATVAGRTDPDAIPKERPTAIKPGEVFSLGRHRLICGDCTQVETLSRVMGETRAALVFTSPPYAEQRKQQYGGISTDRYVEWFGTVQAAFRPVLKPTGHFVLNIKPHATEVQRQLYVFDLVSWLVRSAGWVFVDEFCWLRTGIPQQVRHRFKNAFEPCYWFAVGDQFVWYPEAVKHASDDVPIALGPGAGDTNAAKRQGKGGGAIQGNTVAPGWAYPSNVLDIKQNAQALGHPAAFPVQLPSFFVACLTTTDDAVIDPFLGSGTTLMACETTGRSGFGVEVLPGYCQIIIDRWEAFTGQRAEKVAEVSTGKPKRRRAS
jgi:site-specific DNA-methyltransferase (adenine-specific)